MKGSGWRLESAGTLAIFSVSWGQCGAARVRLAVCVAAVCSNPASGSPCGAGRPLFPGGFKHNHLLPLSPLSSPPSIVNPSFCMSSTLRCALCSLPLFPWGGDLA